MADEGTQEPTSGETLTGNAVDDVYYRRTTALHMAIALCGHVISAGGGGNDPDAMVVGFAKTFEAYVTAE